MWGGREVPISVSEEELPLFERGKSCPDAFHHVLEQMGMLLIQF
jgi:hypothetical protein